MNIFFLDAAGGGFLLAGAGIFLGGILLYTILKSGILAAIRFSNFKKAFFMSQQIISTATS